MKLSGARALGLMACAAVLAGCGGQTEYRHTGGMYAARGPACDFRVIRNRIVEPYEEIGVIQIAAFHPNSMPDDEEHFRRVVAEDVCNFGGHAVIPAIDLYGNWVLGTVIRFRPSECARCGAEHVMKEGG